MSIPEGLTGRRRENALASLKDSVERPDDWAQPALVLSEQPVPGGPAPDLPSVSEHASAFAITDCAGNTRILFEPPGADEWTDDLTEAVMEALWNAPAERVMDPGSAVVIRRLS